MPTYEYRCPNCGNAFDKFQRMSDQPVAECPSCGTQAERRISGGAGLLFKGSGFYITDYARGDSYKKAAQADSGGGSSSPAGGSEGGSSSGGDKPAPAAKPAESKPAESKPAPKND